MPSPQTPKPPKSKKDTDDTASKKYHPPATRIQALTLLLSPSPPAVTEISKITGMTRSSIYRLGHTARMRGYDESKSRLMKEEYVMDLPRSGRPKKLGERERREVGERVRLAGGLGVNSQTKGKRGGHEEESGDVTSRKLGEEFGVSRATVRRVVREEKRRREREEKAAREREGTERPADEARVGVETVMDAIASQGVDGEVQAQMQAQAQGQNQETAQARS